MAVSVPPYPISTTKPVAEDLHSQTRGVLLERYRPLVRSVVRRLGINPPPILDLEDLESYGMAGLLQAIDRFDPARGVRFETFAVPVIRAAIIGALRNLDTLTRDGRKKARRIVQATETLTQKLGAQPTARAVAAEVGLSERECVKLLAAARRVVVPLDENNAGTEESGQRLPLADVLADPDTLDPGDEVARRDLRERLRAALQELPQRERTILLLYYWEELPQHHIGTALSISECRVQQLRHRALAELRRRLTDRPMLELPSSSVHTSGAEDRAGGARSVNWSSLPKSA